MRISWVSKSKSETGGQVRITPIISCSGTNNFICVFRFFAPVFPHSFKSNGDSALCIFNALPHPPLVTESQATLLEHLQTFLPAHLRPAHSVFVPVTEERVLRVAWAALVSAYPEVAFQEYPRSHPEARLHPSNSIIHFMLAQEQDIPHDPGILGNEKLSV